VPDEPLLASPELPVVGPRLRQAQRPVRATPDHVRLLVLAVILPEADRADRIASALAERPAAAAGAAVRPLARWHDNRVARHLLEVPPNPPPAALELLGLAPCDKLPPPPATPPAEPPGAGQRSKRRARDAKNRFISTAPQKTSASGGHGAQ